MISSNVSYNVTVMLQVQHRDGWQRKEITMNDVMQETKW